ncbi:MAG: DUF5916 domain-containing protein [Saprospiraceae bacterium]
MKQFLSAIFLFFLFALQAQEFSTPYSEDFQSKYQIRVFKSETPINIDGELSDLVWEKAESVGDFWEKYPSDQVKATLNTTVQAAFDDKYLYFAITCYDTTNHYISPSLKRDLSIQLQDGIALILDPVNKKSNGFGFAVTPYNVQSEYQFGANTTSEDLSFAWDNKWFSGVKRYANRYVIEMAIPFKTLRFDAGNKVWGLNIIRSDQKNNKFYTWTNVPVNFPGFDIGYLGTMTFEDELPPVKGNISLIPYVTSKIDHDPENGVSTKASANAGFDAKVSLTPSLNMDLTVNPDFSQVDVDQQVTNLTRFNISFPEKRTFFLENDDIFSAYGAPPFRPFFSRKIGLDDNAQPIPILFGGRISGNINQKLRVGIMNIQTGRKDAAAPQNYSAVSVLQRIFKRSLIKAYGLNRQAKLTNDEIKSNPLNQYGRNAGAELNFSDQQGKWQGWLGHHLSQKPGIKNHSSFTQFGGQYNGRKLASFIDFASFGKNYYADMGFINRIETFAAKGSNYISGDTTIRNGYTQIYWPIDYFLYPKKGAIIRHNIGIENYAGFYADGKLSDRYTRMRYFMFMRNTGVWSFRVDIQQDNLRYYFPLPSEKPLPPGIYHYTNGNVEYTSDTRKNLLFTGSMRIGQFYNGTINQIVGGVTVRQQPHWNLALNLEYDLLKFPKPYGDTKFWLISPKTEINFSNNLFWTTFFQYNTQRNNFNINSRVQWRYKPMSDLFIVYSDNYFTDTFKNRNRALVLKLNYWLTV